MKLDDTIREGLRATTERLDPDVDAAWDLVRRRLDQPPPRRRLPVAGAVALALFVAAVVGVVAARDDSTEVSTGQPTTASTTVPPSTPSPASTSIQPSSTSTPASTALVSSPTTIPEGAGQWEAYIGLVDPEPPAGVIDNGGGVFVLGPPEGRTYGFRQWQSEDVHVLLIQRYSTEGAYPRPARVIEVLAARMVGGQWFSAQGHCRTLDGGRNPFLITIVDYDDEDGIVVPSAAWRFDPVTEKVSRIDPSSISCELPGG